MKAPTLVISAVFVSLLALSQSGVISQDDVSSYSLIDPIIEAILEKMRSKFSNLTFPDIDERINTSKVKATIVAKGLSIQNANTFVIKNLKSSLVPLKLVNLTLTWDNIVGKGSYNVDANVTVTDPKTPARIFAKGDARVLVKGIFITVGANMELKDKVPQIKPRGLFGFDLSIKSVEVTLTSLMGSPELGKAVGDLIGRIVPDCVNTLKKPLFDAFHDNIVNILNSILKKYATVLADELPEELSFEDLDSSEELDYFPGEILNFKETEFGSEA